MWCEEVKFFSEKPLFFFADLLMQISAIIILIRLTEVVVRAVIFVILIEMVSTLCISCFYEFT